jgi:hypothetical protein
VKASTVEIFQLTPQLHLLRRHCLA